MSEHNNFTVKLHSPRWGTDDPYDIEMDRKQMSVGKLGPSKAILNYVEGRDPEWSGGPFMSKHPLVDILENDSIYPPTIFIRALEFAWSAWRNHELDDVEVETEVGKIFDWVNEVSKSRPTTKFWRTKF
jgi:hypothetical protein